MMLINGFHGGISPGIDSIGYSVFIIVNIAFYYAFLSVIATIWAKLQARKTPRRATPD